MFEAPGSEADNARTLEFFNGLGGFAAQGREYTIASTQPTPAPWINVIANPGFGFQTSVEGSGFTWAINSQQHQLSPWSNDAVSDRPGEVLYVRDEDDGAVWTPTALPIREEDSPDGIRHGQCDTRFEHVAHGIALDLLQLVPEIDPAVHFPADLVQLLGRQVLRRQNVLDVEGGGFGHGLSFVSPWLEGLL